MVRGVPALVFRAAQPDDAVEIATLRAAAARDLVARFGPGPWGSECTERGVLAGYRLSTVIVAFVGGTPVGTFRVTSRKPWAIDRTLFTPAKRPLYLTDMAVHPDFQRQGIGRALLAEAIRVAQAFPADAIWLDAYDAAAGAAPFYAASGFRECARRPYRGTPLVYFEHPVPPPAAV